MNENLDYIISRDITYWGVFIFILLISMLFYGIGKNNDSLCNSIPNNVLSRLLFVITILFLTFCTGADKIAYESYFIETCRWGILHKDNIGWEIIEYVISLLTNSSYLFFFIIASIYTYFNYWFCKQNTRNFLPLYIAVISFMGFYSYGVNTLKSGLSLSLVLCSFALYRKRVINAYVVAVFAFFIHYSMVIPLLAFWVSHRLQKMKYYYYIWIICIFLSIAFGNFFQLYLGGFLGADAMYSDYLLTTETERYRLGFRYDFLFYSAVPIIWMRLFFKDYKNERWLLYYKTYILVNSFWILVIFIPFSDRVAYLSWFLIPYIILVPILDRYATIRHRVLQFVFSFLIFAGFNIFTIFFR